MKALILLFSLLVGIGYAETRHALIMGVWKYEDPTFPPLPEQGIRADVLAMKQTLSALGFRVTVVENPSLKDAKLAVDAFGATIKHAPGTALFYFSGHGSEFEGKNFLVPIDTAITSNRDLDTEALAADRVLSRMEESDGLVNILFLDCCRNSLAKSAVAGFAPMDARGTFIGFATSSQKVSTATQQGSLYTQILAKHLGTPGVSILDMHTLVTQEVSNVDRTQVPHQYSGLSTLFYFRPLSTSNTPPSPLALSQAEIERRAQLLAQEMTRRATAASQSRIPDRSLPSPNEAPADAEDLMLGKLEKDPSGTQLLTTAVCLQNPTPTAIQYETLSPSGWTTKILPARSEKVVILSYGGGIRLKQDGRFRRQPMNGFTQPHYDFNDPNLTNMERMARQRPNVLSVSPSGNTTVQ